MKIYLIPFFFFIRVVRTDENLFRFSHINAIIGPLNSSQRPPVNRTEFPGGILLKSRQHVLLHRVTRLNYQALLSLFKEADDST